MKIALTYDGDEEMIFAVVIEGALSLGVFLKKSLANLRSVFFGKFSHLYPLHLEPKA